MARTNTANKFTEKTHEGALAARMTPLQALRRSVASCFLWEDGFYEDGVEIAQRIHDLATRVAPADVAALAIQARTQFKLRHAPLWLLVALAKTGTGTRVLGDAIPMVVKRADELGELISMYWKANPTGQKDASGKDKNAPLSAQMKRGLAAAFDNFREYHFAKYDRDGAVKLRDVLFLVHPKPSPARQELYKRIAERKLETPDTWEVGLSAGKDKKETFERLIREDKLGYLAMLRNLRNMADAGCDEGLIRAAILERKGADRVLPFRYVAAARAAPRFERELDGALMATIAEMPKLSGTTAVMVDVSGSMRQERLSAKSDMYRIDAAATLASMLNGTIRLFSFADNLMELPPRRGMAGVDMIRNSQQGGTKLFDAVALMNKNVKYDRLIVITDEQAFGPGRQGYEQSLLKTCPDPQGIGYMINVASDKNGVGYGKWRHIDGFSENVFSWIRETEAL